MYCIINEKQVFSSMWKWSRSEAAELMPGKGVQGQRCWSGFSGPAGVSQAEKAGDLDSRQEAPRVQSRRWDIIQSEMLLEPEFLGGAARG